MLFSTPGTACPGAPVIVDKVASTPVLLGHLLHLQCVAGGAPTPTVHWKRQGDDIDDSTDRVQVGERSTYWYRRMVV